MRVGVVGAGGKMGQEVCRTVLAQPDLDLVAAVDPGHGGADLGALIGTDAGSLTVTGDSSPSRRSGPRWWWTSPAWRWPGRRWPTAPTRGSTPWSGTTGFTASDLDDLERQFAGPASGAPNCVVAANFAIGAVLMMRFAEMAAPYFGRRRDRRAAPRREARRAVGHGHAGPLNAWPRRGQVAGSGAFRPDGTVTLVQDGARGGEGPGQIRIHSVRLAGLVAHQEVILGGDRAEPDHPARLL